MKEKWMDYIRHHRENTLKFSVAVIFIVIAAFIFIGKDHEEPIIIETTDPAFSTDQEVEQDSEHRNVGEKPEPSAIYVHLSGAVKEPGVLKLSENTRLFEAVAMAGGLEPEADSSGINMARILRDEEQIHIPREGEALSETAQSLQSLNQPYGKGTNSANLIDINTADSEMLQTLSGVGPSIAAKIIDYRQHSGPFRSIDQILEVSGIGEKTFAKFKDKICI